MQSAATLGERKLWKPTFQLRVGKPRRIEGGPEQEADDTQEQVIERIPAMEHSPLGTQDKEDLLQGYQQPDSMMNICKHLLVSVAEKLKTSCCGKKSSPEVAGDPVILPLLIVLVCDLEVHLIRNPGHADPYHQRQRIREAPAKTQGGH